MILTMTNEMKINFLLDHHIFFSLFYNEDTYLIAIYLHNANVTVKEMEIVCNICEKCM